MYLLPTEPGRNSALCLGRFRFNLSVSLVDLFAGVFAQFLELAFGFCEFCTSLVGLFVGSSQY